MVGIAIALWVVCQGHLSSPVRGYILFFHLQSLAQVLNKLILDWSNGIEYEDPYVVDSKLCSTMTQTDLESWPHRSYFQRGKISKYKQGRIHDLLLKDKIAKLRIPVVGPGTHKTQGFAFGIC